MTELKIFWPSRSFDNRMGFILGWYSAEVVVVATVLQGATVS